MSKRIKRAAFVVILVIVMLVLTSFFIKDKPQTIQVEYIVRPGDTLTAIAAEYNVKNFNKWRYETCKANGIEKGGLIYPGDNIIIYLED